jgi:hypothetical protein
LFNRHRPFNLADSPSFSKFFWGFDSFFVPQRFSPETGRAKVQR